MRSISPIRTLPALILAVILPAFSSLSLEAQDRKALLQESIFAGSEISWDDRTQMPSSIKVDASTSLTEAEFLTGLKRTFQIPDELQFIPLGPVPHVKTGPGSDEYIRYTQH